MRNTLLTALRHQVVGIRGAFCQNNRQQNQTSMYSIYHYTNQTNDEKRPIHSIQYSKNASLPNRITEPLQSLTSTLCNPILQNHTPLRPTIILRPPDPLPLPASTHQPARINNMTPLKRQRERLCIRIRQDQRMRQRIQRQSRTVRPVCWPD
jgi:hypothetical protein